MTNLIDTMPLSALVTIHNSLTANQVRKFENRTKATRRIADVLKNHGGMTFAEAAKAAGFATTDAEKEAEADATLTGSRYNAKGDLVKIVIPPERDAEQDEQDARDAALLDLAGPVALEVARANTRIGLLAPRIADGSLMRVDLTVGEIAALAQLVFAGPESLGETMATTLLEKLRTATPATPAKPARPARAKAANPRLDGMTAAQRTITDLCQRPQGATGKELAEGCGWPSIAARTTCQKLADRFGFTLTETPKTEGRGIAFHMAPKA